MVAKKLDEVKQKKRNNKSEPNKVKLKKSSKKKN
jgi:hypothetical protein